MERLCKQGTGCDSGQEEHPASAMSLPLKDMTMRTLHHRRHSVNAPYSHQSAPVGLRRRSPLALAKDIAASIRQHEALGDYRTPAHYTPNPETQALVQQLLAAEARA